MTQRYKSISGHRAGHLAGSKRISKEVHSCPFMVMLLNLPQFCNMPLSIYSYHWFSCYGFHRRILRGCVSLARAAWISLWAAPWTSLEESLHMQMWLPGTRSSKLQQLTKPEMLLNTWVRLTMLRGGHDQRLKSAGSISGDEFALMQTPILSTDTCTSTP